MPIQLSEYEPVAAAFLRRFPIGTSIGGEEILGFAQDYKDGLASDLLVGDPTKRLNSIKRHLNHGAASRNFAEDERFIIVTEDAKNKMFSVQKLSARMTENAKDGIEKSVSGAVAPINSRMRGLDSIKKDELSDTEREMLETQMRELLAFQQQTKPFLTAEVTEHFIRQIVAAGSTEAEARRMLSQNAAILGYNRMMKKLQ